MLMSDLQVTGDDLVAFAGDWHGNTPWALTQLNIIHSQGAQIVVHVGDFGAWNGAHFPDLLNKWAQRNETVIMFVDGNHEQHPWLLNQPIDDDGVRRLYPNIWHLPRGYRWEWAGVRFLALGGAHSVERQQLRPHINWFAEEAITARDARLAVEGGHADVMITHDCPDRVSIPGIEDDADKLDLRDLPFPIEELQAAAEHRRLLGAVVDQVQPRTLFHGHYHVRYDAVRQDVNETQIVGLNCDRRPRGENHVIKRIGELA